jgi:hypothetical protein
MGSIALPLTGIDSHISKLLEVNPTLKFSWWTFELYPHKS